MKPIITLLFLISISLNFFSQGFINVSEEQGIDIVNVSPFFGAGVSFYDFDNDGWDDLSFCLKNDSVAFYKNDNGNFTPLPSFYDPNADVKSCTWADYDNDGDADVLICVYQGQTKLFRNDGNWNFTDVTDNSGIPIGLDARTFGASWADYDKDGYLDIYICNFDIAFGIKNWFLHNNGDGTFDEIAEEMGMDNDSHKTFQSTWIDYNNDTWPDLYIINENAPINVLYKNNGDGTFTDVSETSGTDLSINAMCNAVSDYDNDGDLDIYVTNDPNGNVLLVNNGDETFSDLTDEAGLLHNIFSWGALWIDYDHNLSDDLFVISSSSAGSNPNVFYMNDGMGVFADSTNAVGIDENAKSYSNVKGDFNNDGFYDMAVNNASPETCFLYQNTGGENHFIKISLEGTASNRDAIGTWINTYIGADKYVEYTMSGENYLGQDSQYEIISLAENLQADSIEFIWPSGLSETYYNVQADQTVHYIEGATLSYPIAYDGELSFCTGDSLILDAGIATSYSWSTSDTTQFITVFEGGDYSVDVINSDGFLIALEEVSVEVFIPESINEDVEGIYCYGEENGSITLSAEGEGQLISVLWETGDTTFSIYNLSGGLISYIAYDQNNCEIVGVVNIIEADSACHVPILIDPSCFGSCNGSVDVEFCGGTPPYNFESLGDSLCAGFYNVLTVDANGCEVVLEVVLNDPEPLEVELDITDSIDIEATGSAIATISGGSEPYDILWSTGSEEESVFALEAGDYSVTVTDNNGCSITIEFTVNLYIGINDLMKNNQIAIFPNPAHEHLNIVNVNRDADIQVQIVDMLGKVHIQTTISGTNPSIDISELSVGEYIIDLKEEGISYFRTQFIKR